MAKYWSQPRFSAQISEVELIGIDPTTTKDGMLQIKMKDRYCDKKIQTCVNCRLSKAEVEELIFALSEFLSGPSL